MIPIYHLQTNGQPENTVQTLEILIRDCALQWEGTDSNIETAPYKTLYGKSLIVHHFWVKVGEQQVIESSMVLETVEQMDTPKVWLY